MKTYLEFVELEYPNRKTKVWEVKSLRGYGLGVIQWYSAWRQYTFQPYYNTVWNVGCLRDIESFIAKAMDERKVT